MVTTMNQEPFQMSPNPSQKPEISRRETEKMRAELIVEEMAEAVRFLGGNGNALSQINKASRATKLHHTIIERLRWKKYKRPFADIVDTVREAVERSNEEGLKLAKHQAFIARKQAAVLAARLAEIDPDFYGPEIDRLGFGDGEGRNGAHSVGGD